MIINGNKIIADEGKILIRKADNYVLGKSAKLGYTFVINGKTLSEKHLEVPEDYTEIDDKELKNRIEIYGMYWPVTVKTYSELKDFLVKIKYSTEDQIAVICNKDLHPNDKKYQDAYTEMQEWRTLAGRIAKNWLNKSINSN